mmetsp:Transcript_59926/g.125310  ORF Transcript_59926/g.125310 Transcript_59926/m.125310 type:complete len:253 (-) Transcript_59926:484-1242(-)
MLLPRLVEFALALQVQFGTYYDQTTPNHPQVRLPQDKLLPDAGEYGLVQGLAEGEDADGHEPRGDDLERQQHLGRRGAVPLDEEDDALRVEEAGDDEQHQHQYEERLLVSAPVQLDEGVDGVLLHAIVEAGEQLGRAEHHGGEGGGDQGDEGGELQRGDALVVHEADLLENEPARLAEAGQDHRANAGEVPQHGLDVCEGEHLAVVYGDAAENGAGEDDQHREADVEVHLPLNEGKYPDEEQGRSSPYYDSR